MNPKKNIPRTIPPKPENPFKVPEGYFNDVRHKVMERIRAEAQDAKEQNEIRAEAQDATEQNEIRAEAQDATEQDRIRFHEKTANAPLTGEKEQSMEPIGKEVSRRKKIYLQPYLTLAAVISGIALVVYIVLQSVIGSRSGDDMYDIATLDGAGVIQDESLLAETFTGEEEESTYSEWDEEAIVYLASNEVDLLDLLDTN